MEWRPQPQGGSIWGLWGGYWPWLTSMQCSQQWTSSKMWTFLVTNSLSEVSVRFGRTNCVPWQGTCEHTLPMGARPPPEYTVIPWSKGIHPQTSSCPVRCRVIVHGSKGFSYDGVRIRGTPDLISEIQIKSSNVMYLANFVGSMCTSPFLMTSPRYSTEAWSKAHFISFKWRSSSCICLRTLLVHSWHCSSVSVKIRILLI